MRLVWLMVVVLGLGGCETVGKWFESGPAPVEVLPEETLYQKAKAKLDSGNYTRAIELYQALESRYPFGRHGAQVLLDLAYAHYKQGDSEAALATLERFFKVYPTHERLDYAWYLRGLIHTAQGMGFVERYFPIDLTKRDVTPLQAAYQDFVTLLEQFPESEYADEAGRRKTGLFNLLAAHELRVADFYFRRGAYLAAADRARRIVEEYPRTTAIPHALKLMEKSYRLLELDDLADGAARLYRINFGDRPPPPLRRPPHTALGWLFWLFRWD